MVIRRAIYRLVRIGLVNAVMGRRRRRAVREMSAIQSNRAALSRSAITVSQGEFELESVEAALSGLNEIRNPRSGGPRRRAVPRQSPRQSADLAWVWTHGR
jgi:hypothetical protein